MTDINDGSDDLSEAVAETFWDVEVLNLIPGLAQAADETKDPEAKACILAAMRAVVDAVKSHYEAVDWLRQFRGRSH
jgi:hypothetical protein